MEQGGLIIHREDEEGETEEFVIEKFYLVKVKEANELIKDRKKVFNVMDSDLPSGLILLAEIKKNKKESNSGIEVL